MPKLKKYTYKLEPASNAKNQSDTSGEIYRLVCLGTVKAGHDVESVKKRVASVLEKDMAVIDRLISGKPMELKRSPSLNTCLKLFDRLMDTGAEFTIQRVAA